MKEIFDFTDGVMKKTNDIASNCWVNLIDPTKGEISEVSAFFGVDKNDLHAALDEDESTRLVLDNGILLMVVYIPIVEKNSKGSYYYSTIPLGLVSCEKGLITICARQSTVVSDFITGRMNKATFTSQAHFILSVLLSLTAKFLQCLKHIDNESTAIEARLSKTIKNEELMHAMRLEKSLMYFSASLNGNNNVFLKLQRSAHFSYSPDEIEMLDDIAIENKQAVEMCNIFKNILSSTMDTKASIISNNLSIAMKWLTSLTIVLTIPTIIFGLFGINTGIPWQGDHIGFWMVLGISFLLSVVAAVMLWKNDLF